MGAKPAFGASSTSGHRSAGPSVEWKRVDFETALKARRLRKLPVTGRFESFTLALVRPILRLIFAGSASAPPRRRSGRKLLLSSRSSGTGSFLKRFSRSERTPTEAFAMFYRVEDSDMGPNRRIFVLAFCIGAAVLMAPLAAFAEDHLAEAITHTKQAIEHGKQGHADVLVTHAEAALTHANAAEKAKANPHTKQGVTHLEAAIDEGKKKRAEAATKHAEEALTHLQAAAK
jgi:hypothetical protein